MFLLESLLERPELVKYNSRFSVVALESILDSKTSKLNVLEAPLAIISIDKLPISVGL